MNSTTPLVTVVMPIRNEGNYIEKSLGAVLHQDYPSEKMEIIIADGMSTDNTRDIIRTMQAQYSLTLIDNPSKYVPAGLNRAIRLAKGEVIIRVDGHCELASDYVRRCVTYLDGHPDVDCVGGALVTVGETLVARTIAVAMSSPFGVGGVAFRTGSQKGRLVDTLAFGAYRRDVFDKIGLFDEELVRNQDDEFNVRLTQTGGLIWLDPDITSTYYSRAGFKGLWKQYFQYGFYKVRVMQKRGTIPSWRHLVPSAFVGGLFLSMVLALITKQPLWLLLAAGPYAFANSIASLLTARKNMVMLPILPIAFLILHLSYGLGFLGGLWCWRKHYFERDRYGKST